MKKTIKAVLLLGVLSAGVLAYAGSVTIGTYDNANCYPFMCNDSGTDMGRNLDYQQVYDPSAFPGKVFITALTFYWADVFGGSDKLLGGNYLIILGLAPFGSVNNLSTNLASNVIPGTEVTYPFNIPSGGVPFGSSYKFSISTTPFHYNSLHGDLLLWVVARNQDNVPNGSGNSYMEADDTGSLTSRAYCIGNGMGCSADPLGLVTSFDYTPDLPTPDSLALACTGLLVLAGAFRWKR